MTSESMSKKGGKRKEDESLFRIVKARMYRHGKNFLKSEEDVQAQTEQGNVVGFGPMTAAKKRSLIRKQTRYTTKYTREADCCCKSYR